MFVVYTPRKLFVTAVFTLTQNTNHTIRECQHTQLHLPPNTATLTFNKSSLTAHALPLLLYPGTATKAIPWPRMCSTLRGTLSQLYQHPNVTPHQRLSSADLRYPGVLKPPLFPPN